MKHCKKLLFASALAFLGACSSMQVDNSVEDSLPSDFVTSVFSQLNPEYAQYQLRASVANSNLAVLDAMKSSDEAVSTAAVATYTADTTAFFGDSAVVHAIFLKAGFLDTAWHTPKAMTADQKRIVLSFNSVTRTPAQDLAYMNSFVADEAQLDMQYILYGYTDGRPYKYCVAGAYGALKSASQATKNDQGGYDYRPNTYCTLQSDNQVYLNK